MKKYFYCITASIVFFSFTACKKRSSPAPAANPLSTINASWQNTVWGGVSNNPIVIKIDQNTKNGIVQSIGSQTFNFAAGETILSSITATATTTLFNCNAIFKYGGGNQTVANTTATITVQSNGQQILIHYAPAAEIQPPDYVYTKL
jgi:hypothetical protein